MKMNGREQRQYMACGYEPALDPTRVRLTIWNPPAATATGNVGYRGPNPTVCPGYTTRLPEVQETALLRLHWENGVLRDACGGETPTEETLSLIVVLQGAYNALQRWVMTPASDGGGGA